MITDVRIGTWNLAGRWSEDHARFLADLDCDVLLLTEVNECTELPGYSRHLGGGRMAAKRRWAGVLSRSELTALPDPHPASAAAKVDGLTLCSTVLPWRSCGGNHPWTGDSHAERTRHALDALTAALPAKDLVWGGDWNHALEGSEYAGSRGGRTHLLSAITRLGLKVPTAQLPHRIDGLLTIDHLAVGVDVTATHAARVVSAMSGRHLSDHDAYLADVEV